MKKYGLLISIVIVVSFILLFYDNNKKSILESKNKTWESSNIITIMYETEAGSGEYQAADSNEWLYDGYIFNTELSKCENGSTLTWDDASKKVLMQANTSDKCYIYFDKIVAVNLVEYITTQVYTGVDGENSLYYHDGTGSYTNSNQEIGDDSYRYSGKTPNNYVCFGSDYKVVSSKGHIRDLATTGKFGNSCCFT